MSKKITASKSFGGDYDCLKEWPEGTFLQCGGSGIVIGKAPYRTAFFEAFPKDPKTFIRGEGKTIEEAEANAWDKYQNIINCETHSFNRVGNSQTAYCNLCFLKLTNYYKPLNSCCVCGKEHTKNIINSKIYCLEHFLEEANKLNSSGKFDNLEYLFYSELSENDFESEDYYIYEEALVANYALNNNYLENMEDYKKSDYIDEMSFQFDDYLNKVLYKSMKVESDKTGFHYLFTINSKILLKKSFSYNKELSDVLLQNFFEKTEFNNQDLFISHVKDFIDMYRIRMPDEEYCRIIEKQNA